MSEWISVEDRLPESGKTVIAHYKNRCNKHRTIIGHYIKRYSIEAVTFEHDDCYEYNEEKDEYYLTPGWYEQQDNWGDYAYIGVCEGEVDHWMPLPPPPRGDENE